jgi:hypothetical protein
MVAPRGVPRSNEIGPLVGPLFREECPGHNIGDESKGCLWQVNSDILTEWCWFERDSDQE